MSFDAFGARRKTNWAGELTQAETEALLSDVGIGTSRGYTGHEHLDRTGLIHMNGRVYDPTLGRFLSADPIVQAPYFSQSYNRYTYVWNNPLGMNDPSGYEGNDSFGEDDKEAPPELVIVETVDKDGNKFDIVMTVSRAKEVGAMDDEGKANKDAPLTVTSKSGKKKGGLVGVSSGHAAGKAQKDNATSQQQGGDTAGVARGGGGTGSGGDPRGPGIYDEAFEDGANMRKGAEGLYEDFFRVRYHYRALAGDFGTDVQADAELAENVLTTAAALYYYDAQISVNGKMVNFRAEAHSAALNSISHNKAYFAGRQLAQGAMVGLITRYAPGGMLGKAPLGVGLTASMTSVAGYGRALNLYDYGVRNSVSLMSAAIAGK